MALNYPAAPGTASEANVIAALAVGATAKDMGGGAVTNVGLVDGRDVATDGTKLDGVATSADVTADANVRAALAAASATLDCNGQTITNVGTVDGRNVATDGTALDLLVVRTKTITTGSIAAGGGSETGSLTGMGGSMFTILQCFAKVTAGASVKCALTAFDEDTHTNNETFIYGDSTNGLVVGATFGGAGGQRGPSVSAQNGAMVSCYDADATSEFHWKVYNSDGVSAGTYEIRFSYILSTVSLA